VPDIRITLATLVGAYLLGSIPFGHLVAKVMGTDIRRVGSGNIGATNVMRVLGKPAGIFVLLMDALKGFAACYFLAPFIYDWISPHLSGFAPPFSSEPKLAQLKMETIAGIGAVLGHNYTCWLKFKGGKGVATTAGVFLALAPWALLIGLIVFLLTVLITRYVSLGSIAAAIALPATVWVMSPDNLFLGIVTTSLGLLAIYKHKGNIQRLMQGTENRLGQKKAEAAE
jgi:glycerol-3-phosphate acyltransferase PlsY